VLPDETLLRQYVIRREDDDWVFTPSPLLPNALVFMWGFGCALMLYLSGIFFRHASEVSADWWIGGAFVLVAGYSAFLAIRAWRTRQTPLTIEFDGRVRYGQEVLCAAGTVVAVTIASARDGEVGDCEVGLDLGGGRTVFLPPFYFGLAQPRDHVRPFAAKLAQALKVGVTEKN
jgi:hypothetical protein